MRAFSERTIDEADLERILEAGRRAPSSRNWQPWDFVVVSERARLVELAKVWRKGAHVADSAVTVALIGPVLDDEMQQGWLQFDTGQAMMSMLIAAADMGIGSGHSAVQDQDLLRSLLGLPADRFGIALMPLGYPRDAAARADRRAGPATACERRAPRALVARFIEKTLFRMLDYAGPLLDFRADGEQWARRRVVSEAPWQTPFRFRLSGMSVVL